MRESSEVRPGLSASSPCEDVFRGNYEILRDIGEGSFVQVKLACHILTRTKMAVKVLRTGIHAPLFYPKWI